MSEGGHMVGRDRGRGREGDACETELAADREGEQGGYIQRESG